MKFRVALSALMLSASPVTAADWSEATTAHMIVYSEQSADDARELAIKLERMDEAMRFMLNIPKDKRPLPDSAKLTVFHFGDTDDIGRLAGAYGVYGFFMPRAGNSTAYIPLKEAAERGSIGTRVERGALTPDIVMFHEYAHYFMFQHAAAAYPAWYIEGFAEVYGTIDIQSNGFVLGAPAKHRGATLSVLGSYRVERLLDPPEELQWKDGAQIYAMGWLLSHYLSFSEDRRGQLDKYFALINQGKTNKEAAEGAFGNLSKLNRDLDRYQRSKIRGVEVTFPDYKLPDVAVRPLTEAEAAIMPYRIRSSAGVDENEAAKIVGPVRGIAEQYPDSIPVLLELVEAEYDAANYNQSEAAVRRILNIEPENVRAHTYLGNIALRRAEDDPAQFEIARSAFALAARLDRYDPLPLFGYYLSYRLAGQTPPENALIALEMAYEFAPFDDGIRVALAHLLLTEHRNSDALAVLTPIANNPHGGKRAKRIYELAQEIRQGQTAEAMEYLAPKLGQPDDEEEDDE